MIVAGQLVVIEATRFSYGGCTAMTLGSEEGLESSGVDRVWLVVLAQRDFTSRPVLNWPALRRSTPRKRFITVLEKYLEPAGRSRTC